MEFENINNLHFTLPQILMLIGTAQCLYIIIYLIFRSGKISRGTLPLIYFFLLGGVFICSFLAETVSEIVPLSQEISLFLMGFEPALCVLLIVQISQIYKTPEWHQYAVLLIMPIIYGILSIVLIEDDPIDWIYPAIAIAGALSLASLAFNYKMIIELRNQKNNKERYWLILALLFTNAAFVLTALMHGGGPNFQSWDFVIILYALVFVYLSSTSLFRIYPQAVHITPPDKEQDLSIYEQSICGQIEDLIFTQKVYQEPSYSRSDMARECEASETVISKIINVRFKQSFPQLMNEFRVKDAKSLLKDTQEPMKVIAVEAGFNSLASFNRVFKTITGESPSSYRGKVE